MGHTLLPTAPVEDERDVSKTVSVQNLEGTENGTEMGSQRRHVGGEGRVHGGSEGGLRLISFAALACVGGA
jgi:hypothetical protein